MGAGCRKKVPLLAERDVQLKIAQSSAATKERAAQLSVEGGATPVDKSRSRQSPCPRSRQGGARNGCPRR